MGWINNIFGSKKKDETDPEIPLLIIRIDNLIDLASRMRADIGDYKDYLISSKKQINENILNKWSISLNLVYNKIIDKKEGLPDIEQNEKRVLIADVIAKLDELGKLAYVSWSKVNSLASVKKAWGFAKAEYKEQPEKEKEVARSFDYVLSGVDNLNKLWQKKRLVLIAYKESKEKAGLLKPARAQGR